MFYGVKFVYVNLQTDGQAIWQKSKKLLYKITELEKSKNLCSRHNQVGQIIIPMLLYRLRSMVDTLGSCLHRHNSSPHCHTLVTNR